jgi:hypothetical protein
MRRWTFFVGGLPHQTQDGTSSFLKAINRFGWELRVLRCFGITVDDVKEMGALFDIPGPFYGLDLMVT